MIKGCCKDCQERKENCHMVCERYLAYQKRLEEIREKKRKEKNIAAIQFEAIERGQKIARRNRRKK